MPGLTVSIINKDPIHICFLMSGIVHVTNDAIYHLNRFVSSTVSNCFKILLQYLLVVSRCSGGGDHLLNDLSLSSVMPCVPH